MPRSLKVTFALFVAVMVALGFFSIPYLDELTETCTGSPWCGKSISDALDFLGQTDSAAVDFGKYLYQKIIGGVISFIVVLGFTVVAHRAFKKTRELRQE